MGTSTAEHRLNPAASAEIVASGQVANGYYWIKGTGLVADAREFYCILDSGFSLGATVGWWLRITTEQALILHTKQDLQVILTMLDMIIMVVLVV